MTAAERRRVSDGTRLLAFVEDEAEARTARSAGAEALVLREGAEEAAGIASFGRDAPERLGELPELRALGFSSAMIDTGSDRLFDVIGFADLADFAEGCRANDLRCGFAGALEAPDVPRLLPLEPAFLGFREALRNKAGGLDPAICRVIAGLLREAWQTARPHPHPDRIFIRDFLQEMEIGAYGSERGRSQRVRFSIECELTPVEGPRDLVNVYSYDRMMDAVRALMARRAEAFVETLAEALAEDLLADPRVLAVTVRVEKLDLGPGSAGVEIRRARV